MRVRFKITTGLLASIRADISRPHAFAYERVGFVSAAVAWSAWGVLILAQEHHPVADEDYVPDPSVGAMMGPEAIRKAMEWAFMKRSVRLSCAQSRRSWHSEIQRGRSPRECEVRSRFSQSRAANDSRQHRAERRCRSGAILGFRK